MRGASDCDEWAASGAMVGRAWPSTCEPRSLTGYLAGLGEHAQRTRRGAPGLGEAVRQLVDRVLLAVEAAEDYVGSHAAQTAAGKQRACVKRAVDGRRRSTSEAGDQGQLSWQSSTIGAGSPSPGIYG